MQPVTDPLRADFRNMLFTLWKHLNLPDPTPAQYAMAAHLQHGPKRCVVSAFRGCGKSWVLAAFALWTLYCDPQSKILVVSASKARADDFSIFCRRLINDVPCLAHLKAREGQRDSSISFDVGPARPDGSPSLKSCGVTGQLTGSRADLIIADDIETPGNSMTQMMRDRLAESIKEFDAVIKPLPTSRILFLGTPQSAQTLYAELENRGYKAWVWPARFPSKALQERLDGRLAVELQEMLAVKPSLADECGGRGAPTDPKRFNDADLLEREASYGRTGFAMQYQLDSSLNDADRYPLKAADLMVMDCDPKLGPIKLVWGSSPDLARNDLPLVALSGDRLYRPMWKSSEHYVPYQGTIMAIDPSGRGGDELGYAIVAMLNGYLFVLRCRGLKGGYVDENLEHLAKEAKRFGVNEVFVESNFGDGMFLKLLQPFLMRIHPCSTEEDRSTGQKEKRIIDTLEPAMNQHRVVFDSSVIKEDYDNYNGYPGEHQHKYQLMYQLTRITRDKGSLAKDDRLDALALAVSRWTSVMDRDQENLEQNHRENLRDLEIEKFLESAGVLSANRFGIMGEFFGTGDLQGMSL